MIFKFASNLRISWTPARNSYLKRMIKRGKVLGNNWITADYNTHSAIKNATIGTDNNLKITHGETHT